MKSKGSQESIQKMLETLSYRGSGSNRVTKVGAWDLGNVQLSVLDAKGGVQPMTDSGSGAHIVYNGEVYNFAEIKDELGGSFNTQCDTEVILRLHASGMEPEQWLKKLDGMFAFAIVDEKGLLLARDPLGVKPLYLGMNDKQIVFGSEIKAVLAVADRIMEFPPGHVFTSKKGARPFRTLKKCPTESSDPQEIANELLTRITDAVVSRMISDVPLGVFLSGGLGSSIIAAIANTFSPNIKTFAVGMEGSEDLESARRMAKHLGTDHHERVFTIEEATNLLPKVIYHLESYDAALVRRAVANYFLAELASQHVKVVLSGEGADELFAGYEYLGSMQGDRLAKELDTMMRSLHFTNLQRCDRMSMAHGVEMRVPFLDDLRVVEYAMAIPTQFKRDPLHNIDKWILRKAVEGLLPDDVVKRKKIKFAQGVGLEDKLTAWANAQISDEVFDRARKRYEGFDICDKETLAYFLLFREHFKPEKVVPMIGRCKNL